MIRYKTKTEALLACPKSFVWKEMEEYFYCVEQMETMHLFEVLVTLWNKNVKEDFKVEEFLPHNFWDEKTTHTRKYVLQCLEAVLKELSDRQDLKGKCNQTWLYISNCFLKNYVFN